MLLSNIFTYIVVGLCSAYIFGSILFVPCELVMLGVSQDPMFSKQGLFAIVLICFLYKDLALGLYWTLIIIKKISARTFTIVMLCVSGGATLLTPFGVIWILTRLSALQIGIYSSFYEMMVDPIFMDMVLATITFICIDILMVLYLIKPITYKIVKDNKISFGVVPVKKYQDISKEKEIY